MGARPAHRLVRWHLDLAALAASPLTQPRPLDTDLSVRQVDLTALAAVPDRRPLLACLARLLRARHTFGAHLEYRLDRRSAHHLDDFVDRELRVLYELDHRQQELAFSLHELSHRTPVRVHSLLRTFSSSWWLRFWVFSAPDPIGSGTLGATTFLFPLQDLQLRLGQLQRHTFATQLLRDGVDVRTGQKLMGQKDIRTTMIYLRAIDQIGLGVRSPLDRPDGAKR